MTKMNNKILSLARGDDERIPSNLSAEVSGKCDEFFRKRNIVTSYGRFGKGRKSK